MKRPRQSAAALELMLSDLTAEDLSAWLQSKLYRTQGLPTTDWQIIWVHQG